MKYLYLTILLSPLILNPSGADAQAFSYKKWIAGNSTLSAFVQSHDKTTGDVTITGSDSQRPSTPFTFLWGDNTSSSGFFPTTHRYTNTARNYTVRVVANYSATDRDTTEVPVNFVKPSFKPVALNPDARVVIPNQPVALKSRMPGYGLPVRLAPYVNDDLFSGSFSRADLEYALWVFNTIELDFANNDVYRFNNKWEQYMLRDATYGGASALWFTDPMSFAVGDGLMTGAVFDFSSLAHEMGHNITLNSPANFYYGGKIDGNANAIFSESLGQIFQHAVGYEVLNNAQQYGFDEAFTNLMKSRFVSSFVLLKSFHTQYLNGGKPFASWNNPATPTDETLLTFGTIGYKFCEYAEQQGRGFRQPVKRLMLFLQGFNADWQQRYDQFNNTPQANAFRATLMVAALSHAFQKDLRADFRALNFPVSDTDFVYLAPGLFSVSTPSLAFPAEPTGSFPLVLTAGSAWTVKSSAPWLTTDVASGTGNRTVAVLAAANPLLSPRTATLTFSSEGLSDVVVSVNQARASPTLTVSSPSLTLPAAAGITSFTIQSNSTWTVSSSQPWLVPTPQGGTGNATVTLTASANPATTPREATVTVAANGVPNQPVTVVQQGVPVTAVSQGLEPVPNVFPNPSNGRLRVVGLAPSSTVEVLDAQGRTVLKAHPPGQEAELGVSQLTPGAYTVWVRGNRQTNSYRLLIP